MPAFKRGDIVRQEPAGGPVEFFHVDYVHANGSIDATADADGRPVGLNAHRSQITLATMDDLLAHRARVAGRHVVEVV